MREVGRCPLPEVLCGLGCSRGEGDREGNGETGRLRPALRVAVPTLLLDITPVYSKLQVVSALPTQLRSVVPCPVSKLGCCSLLMGFLL